MYITVVGRSKTAHEFGSEISELLYEGFRIIAWYSLGEPGIDEKERFLVIIEASDESEYDSETQATRLQTRQTSSEVFTDLTSALEFAQNEYGLAADKVRAYEEYSQLKEDFPPLSADEKEQFDYLDAFTRLGRVAAMPARLNGERVVAIVVMTHGPGELKINAVAVLPNEEISDGLELPMDAEAE